jgi:hypothetical protein
MKSHRDIDRRSLALMEAVAEKIDQDPEKKGLEKARRVCARWVEMHDNPYLKQWQSILTESWEDIKKILLDKSEEANALRQCNPFCGILSPRERWNIYREFRDV